MTPPVHATYREALYDIYLAESLAPPDVISEKVPPRLENFKNSQKGAQSYPTRNLSVMASPYSTNVGGHNRPVP